MLKRIVLLAFTLMLPSAEAVAAEPVLAAEGSPQAPTEMTIRKTVQEVRVGFQVSSSDGKPLFHVRPEQFSVLEDGQKITTLTGFYADHDLPLRVLLMIDASDSMSKGFASERQAAADFLGRIVRTGTDQSAVIVFSTQMQMSPRAESGEEQRISALHTSGLTALYDAICKVGDGLPARDPEHPLARRILVLLSDGNDTYSMHSLKDAIAAVQKSELVVYAIAAHKPSEYRSGDANLARLAEATGGRFLFLKKYDQSEKLFAEIETEIRAQYTVTFRTNGVCGFHKLEVQPADRSLNVRNRAGFYGDCR